MNAGLAKQIREKWPSVFEEYKKAFSDPWSFHPLGSCQLVDTNEVTCPKYIANLFGQKTYGRSQTRYTSYDAIYEALSELAVKMVCEELNSVAFPYEMSSGLGGADWEIILTMINRVFKDTNITIEIWKYAI